METSEENPVSPTETVTPDLTAQKSPSYGLVAEVKRSLPSDSDHWDRYLEQLQKYDDELVGWWTDTETVATSDAALLIHQSRSRAFLRYLQEQINENPEILSERAAIVEFNRSDEANAYVFFRKEWGGISDPELRESLENGVPVPIDAVLRSFGQVQFYDSPPPIPWLMALLWTDLFLSSYDPSAYDEIKKATPIEVTVEQITEELQKAYGSGALPCDERAQVFPKSIWIRRALEALVHAKLAIPGEDPESYTILYRVLKGDILERFVRMTESGPTPEKPPEPQTALPLEDDRHE
jgi:hypothetical protein